MRFKKIKLLRIQWRERMIVVFFNLLEEIMLLNVA